MQIISNITFSELKQINIPPNANIFITIIQNDFEKEMVLAIMKKLRGSGNGKLNNALLHERQIDSLKSNIIS